MMRRSYFDSGGVQNRRRHSMGSWPTDREEDLALFHDMRTRERDGFLHPFNDDIEASLSTKFGGLSGYRFSVATPTRADLLISDTEKNDYDWLLTPPGTPLFPSLDQEVPIIKSTQRAAVSFSLSASKLSRLSQWYEPPDKAFRRIPTPHRPSTASSTSSTNSTTRVRASSPSVRSSSPIVRSSMTSDRSLTFSRDSTRMARSTKSSKPTFQRTNHTPSIRSSTGKTGSSTGRTLGSSVSPKLQSWQPSFPGFSSEPPPNLRTSLSDHSTSSSRGGPLCTRHGGISAHRTLEAFEMSWLRRQPASPKTPRNSISPNSEDCNRSQTSKGSAVSLHDNKVEVVQSSLPGSKRAKSDCIIGPSKLDARLKDHINGKYGVPAKCQTRPRFTSGDTHTFAGVTTKKSLEPSMRLADHRQSSQGMFRPLLSDVPASSFYSTISTGFQERSASLAGESSLTISSNASSEQGVRIVPHGENSDEDGEDKETAWKEILSPEISGQEPVNKSQNGYDNYHLTSDEIHDVSTGPEDLHPCRSTDSCENNEIDMSEEWSQEASNDENWRDNKKTNHLESPLKFDYISQGLAIGDSTCSESHRDNATPQYCEENIDDLFVDIQEDCSVRSGNLILHELELDDLRNKSICRFQSAEPLALQRVEDSELKCAFEQRSSKQGVINGQQSKMYSSKEQTQMSSEEKLGLVGVRDRNYDLDINIRCFNSQVADYLTDQVVQEHFNNLYINGSQILESNPVSHRSIEHDFHVQEDAYNSTTESQSQSKPSFGSIYLESPYAKLEPTTLGLDDSVEKRMDCPQIIDGLPFGKSDSVRSDVNLTLREKTLSTERIVSCEVAMSTPHFPCQSQDDHQKKIVNIEEGVSISSFTHDGSLERGNERAKAGPCGHHSEMAIEESCHEYFVDSSELRILETVGIRENPANILFVENHAFSSGRVLSLERSDGIEIEVDTHSLEKKAFESCPELEDASMSIEIKSIQILDFDRSLTTDEVANVSFQEIPEHSSQQEVIPFKDAMVENVSENEIELQFCKVETDPYVLSIGNSDIYQTDPKIVVPEAMGQWKCANNIISSESDAKVLNQELTLPGGRCLAGTIGLSENLTQDEKTDTILFCRSIVHDIVYSAVATAMEKEGHAAAATPSPTRELVSHFRFSEAGQRNLSGDVLKNGNWKGKTVRGDSAVRQTSTYAQNQKAILRQTPRQTPSVMIQENFIDKTESAIMKTQKATANSVIKSRKDKRKTNKAKSRCRCTIM